MREDEGDSGSRFERLAGPGSLGFGLLCGLVYTALLYGNTYTDGDALLIIGRLGMALVFLTGGVMGLSYFTGLSKGRRTLPWIVEQQKIFFALWTAFGLVFFLRAISLFQGVEEPPDLDPLSIIVTIMTGTIAGTVFMFGATLFAGRSRDTGSTEVVRFPVWINEEVARLGRFFSP